MESIIARALEYTLKYWLNSFSRDQFKLQGRTAQLSNLDLNGDALHASLGLPPALHVTTARVGKLEIILPPVSYVQVEPIILQIDKLDLVLEENDDMDTSRTSTNSSSSTSGSGYRYADKIADGMTVQVRTVNLLLETHGGARQRGGATWASPMASITIRNLVLYTTNENWEVVNLKEARDFSNDKKFIYVFKKLEWEHLSIDLLPHPDMFADINFSVSQEESIRKDEDGAKRVFFGGERFIEGISGEANITIQRTELNSPLGLEVQIHITEAVCPALSEPGLRALLRFFTGLYVCLNRGDLNPSVRQRPTEAAGRSLVSLVVDHIFLCIKDAEFQLELLMQSLFFSRASVSGGENIKHLTRVLIGGLILRDTFSRPPCTLVQPSMEAATAESSRVPEFVNNFCPPIYPLEDKKWQQACGVPLISLYSLQLSPTPNPPVFASRTVIDCQPLTIHLQEESCLRISSFLADGIVINLGDELPDFSVNSFGFNLKGLDITVPLEMGNPEYTSSNRKTPSENCFSGARLHIEDLMLSESPSLKPKLLNLDNDAACFCLWKGQPIDASQKKLITQASLICLSLDTSNKNSKSSSSWRCVEMKDVCFEVAMVTADGRPLTQVPPPGGIVRVGFACQQYLSNTSVEQFFFVLDLCTYFVAVGERIAVVAKKKNKSKTLKQTRNDSFSGTIMENVPGDTAVALYVKDLQLNFLESSSEFQGMPLVRFMGEGLSIKVGHRTLGGAMAISSYLCWEKVEVDCVETLNNLRHEDGNDSYQLRAVFWVQNEGNCRSSLGNYEGPFLELTMNHVIPYSAQDVGCHSLNVSACVAGVRLGGGMNYTEALLHRFGIFGPDGGPGTGLVRGLEHLSHGPLSKLFKTSPLAMDELRQNGNSDDGKDSSLLHLGSPDDVDISLELKDWLFALEGAREIADRWSNHEAYREENSWLTTFQCVRVKAQSSPKRVVGESEIASGKQKYPVELITVGMEGLQILKPKHQQGIISNGILEKGAPRNSLPERESQTVDKHGGVNVEVDLVTSRDDADDDVMVKWVVENLKFSVKEPIEAVVKNDELQHLIHLCKSEVDSMGRITAGVLRILKLEGSIGSAAISHLSNLGSESFERIFTPERLSRSSFSENSPSYTGEVNRNSNLKLTVASLEGVVLNSQAQCTALATLLSSSKVSDERLDTVRDLNEKLQTMQILLDQLRTEM